MANNSYIEIINGLWTHNHSVDSAKDDSGNSIGDLVFTSIDSLMITQTIE